MHDDRPTIPQAPLPSEHQPRTTSTPPAARAAAVHWTGVQHVMGILAVCYLSSRYPAVEWYYWVGSILAILGIVQLPAALGKGPPGSMSLLAMIAPGMSGVIRGMLHKIHLIGVMLLLGGCVAAPMLPTATEIMIGGWGIVIGMLLGVAWGQASEARKWRERGDRGYPRMHSQGRLYWVSRSDRPCWRCHVARRSSRRIG